MPALRLGWWHELSTQPGTPPPTSQPLQDFGKSLIYLQCGGMMWRYGGGGRGGGGSRHLRLVLHLFILQWSFIALYLFSHPILH